MSNRRQKQYRISNGQKLIGIFITGKVPNLIYDLDWMCYIKALLAYYEHKLYCDNFITLKCILIVPLLGENIFLIFVTILKKSKS